jgi:hypothetical protein
VQGERVCAVCFANVDVDCGHGNGSLPGAGAARGAYRQACWFVNAGRFACPADGGGTLCQQDDHLNAGCNFCNQCCNLTCMAAHDICADIAAVLNPMPAPADQGHDDGWDAAATATLQGRDDEASELRLAWKDGGIDPLLSTLAALRARRLRLEADTRLLIAYARRFTHPRPYKLIDLAEAAGMSISGTRIAYDDDELDQLAELLSRPPLPLPGDGGQRAPEG